MNEAPPRLGNLTWREASRWFRKDPRLILPVGTCIQHGPHLPLATDTIVISRLVDAIAARHQVLVAPVLPYGASSARDVEYAGSASLGAKTLHRVLNELVTDWEGHGLRELLMITAHGYGPHLYAMATVVSETVRIRAVDLHTIDLSGMLETQHPKEHAGELATSLMLHLAPELVRIEEIEDVPVDEKQLRRLMAGDEPVPPAGSIGVVGTPSIASAEKGSAIYEYLVEHIGTRLFGKSAADRTPEDVGTAGT